MTSTEKHLRCVDISLRIFTSSHVTKWTHSRSPILRPSLCAISIFYAQTPSPTRTQTILQEPTIATYRTRCKWCIHSVMFYCTNTLYNSIGVWQTEFRHSFSARCVRHCSPVSPSRWKRLLNMYTHITTHISHHFVRRHSRGLIEQ